MNNLLSMRTFVYTLFGILFLNIAHAQEENTEQTLKDTLSTHTPQELTSLERGKEFIIGGIEVSGAKHYNAQTIIVASGLKVGDKITIPSEKFTRIIHKLWDYQVFNDIDIYITKVEGNKVFLEFAIQEMPELVDVQVTGILGASVTPPPRLSSPCSSANRAAPPSAIASNCANPWPEPHEKGRPQAPLWIRGWA